MSTTRKASFGSPLAQERYMSSVEMAEKEGLKGMPVAAKAASNELALTLKSNFADY